MSLAADLAVRRDLQNLLTVASIHPPTLRPRIYHLGLEDLVHLLDEVVETLLRQGLR